MNPGADFPSHGLPTLSCTVLAKGLVFGIPFRDDVEELEKCSGVRCAAKR